MTARSLAPGLPLLQHTFTRTRWLERFFTTLRENADWLEVVHAGRGFPGGAAVGKDLPARLFLS